MKLKKIKSNIKKEFGSVVFEHSNSDGARIDAVVNDCLAVEFENSYKWIRQRVLYNAVKAKRAGFNKLLIVYPFKPDAIHNSWVKKYCESIGVRIATSGRKNYLERISEELVDL